MISYVKLWFLLKERGMKRTDLLEVISSATLAKLGKNEMVSLSVIEKICDYLDCQPGDILENVKKEKVMASVEEMNKQFTTVLENLSIATGMSIVDLFKEFEKELPGMIEKLENGDTDYIGAEALKKDMESKE